MTYIQDVQYNHFIKELVNIEETFMEQPPKIELEELLSDDKNPFEKIYKNKKNIFKKWQNTTYYRIEAAKASQYFTDIRHVMVFLKPDFKDKEDFKKYIGVYPEYFPKYIEEEKIIPLCAWPEEYRNKKAQKIYGDIFKSISDLGEQYYPVYANRMENCLLADQSIRWDEFKKEKSNIKCQYSSNPIVIGQLCHKNPVGYLGERIAWLELLDLNPIADCIKELAEKNQYLAGILAFTVHDLFSAPIFYNRKTVKTIAPKFDIQTYYEAFEGFVKHKKKYIDTGKAMKITEKITELKCSIIGTYKGAITSEENWKKPIETIVPVPKTDEAQEELRKRIDEVGISELRDKSNEKIPELKNALLNNPENANKIINSIRDIRTEMSDAFLNEFKDKKKWWLARKTSVFGAIVSIGCGFISVPIGVIASLLGSQIDELLNILANKCEKKWTDDFYKTYPLLKFKPTIHAWVVDSEKINTISD